MYAAKCSTWNVREKQRRLGGSATKQVERLQNMSEKGVTTDERRRGRRQLGGARRATPLGIGQTGFNEVIDLSIGSRSSARPSL
jgi:hypothetical protein